MSMRFRSTTFALAGLLALGGVAGCSEGEPTNPSVEEGEGDLEGDPRGEAEESETEGQVEEGEGD